jgi:hypothetical protein
MDVAHASVAVLVAAVLVVVDVADLFTIFIAVRVLLI